MRYVLMIIYGFVFGFVASVFGLGGLQIAVLMVISLIYTAFAASQFRIDMEDSLK